MTVINFSERLEQKQEAAKMDEAKAQFMKVFNEATQIEKEEIIDAWGEKDIERYNAVTRPIIIRQAMREFNQ